MNIAIDWDKTWTAAPDLFLKVAALFQEAGHRVFIVTLRCESEPIEAPIPVYYTSRTGKRAYMESCGVAVDIWMDDKPHFIGWGPAD